MADADINIKINAINNTRAAFADFGMILTGFNSAIGIVREGLNLLKKAYENIIEPTIEFGNKVDELSTLIGLSAEESSKFILAAEQLSISAGTLTSGLQFAITHGFDPSIESIGALADKYNSLKDPVEKSRLLIETFGKKAGPEFAELLEKGSDGIKKYFDSIQTAGLIMSEYGIDVIDDFQSNLEDLNQTFEGLKVSMGMRVLPTLNLLIAAFDRGLDRIFKFGQALGLFEFENYDAFIVALGHVTGLVDDFGTGAGNAVPTIDLLGEAMGDAATKTGELTEATYDLEAAQSQMKTTADFVRDAFRDQGIELENNKWLMDQIALATGDMTREEMAQRDAINDLTRAYADGTLTQSQYLAAILATNQAMLDGQGMAFALAAALDGLPREIRTKILIEQYGYQTGNWSGGNVYGPLTPPPQGPPQANGGPVSAGVAYPVGEEGVEMFVPRENGTIIPNHKLGGGNITVVINTPVNLADETWVERKLYPYIKRGLKEAVRGA